MRTAGPALTAVLTYDTRPAAAALAIGLDALSSGASAEDAAGDGPPG